MQSHMPCKYTVMVTIKVWPSTSNVKGLNSDNKVIDIIKFEKHFLNSTTDTQS